VRLGVAETRIEELSARVDALEMALAAARRETDTAAEASATRLSEQLEAAVARSREDQRRQLGLLDVVRRQANALERSVGDHEARTTARLEEVAARLETTEHGLRADLDHVVDQQRALDASVSQRVATLEGAARSAAGRLDAFEVFRGELAALLDRIGASLRAARDGLAQLVGRIDTLESASGGHTGQLEDMGARLTTQVEALDGVRRELVTVSHAAMALDARLRAMSESIAPLGSLATELEQTSAGLSAVEERLGAAEVMLHQSNDLEAQLERAEAFERLLSEADPDRYASRSDLDALRQLMTEIQHNSHAE
jgi:hypothetical protein